MNHFDSSGDLYARKVVSDYLNAYSTSSYLQSPGAAGYYYPGSPMMSTQHAYPPHAMQQLIQLQQQLLQHQHQQLQLHNQKSAPVAVPPTQQVPTPPQQPQQQQQQLPPQGMQSPAPPAAPQAMTRGASPQRKKSKSNWLFGRRQTTSKKKETPPPAASPSPPTVASPAVGPPTPPMPGSFDTSPENVPQAPSPQRPMYLTAETYAMIANEMNKPTTKPASKQSSGNGCAIM